VKESRTVTARVLDPLPEGERCHYLVSNESLTGFRVILAKHQPPPTNSA
jgi:arginine N-succinyltransferase